MKNQKFITKKAEKAFTFKTTSLMNRYEKEKVFLNKKRTVSYSFYQAYSLVNKSALFSITGMLFFLYIAFLFQVLIEYFTGFVFDVQGFNEGLYFSFLLATGLSVLLHCFFAYLENVKDLSLILLGGISVSYGLYFFPEFLAGEHLKGITLEYITHCFVFFNIGYLLFIFILNKLELISEFDE